MNPVHNFPITDVVTSGQQEAGLWVSDRMHTVVNEGVVWKRRMEEIILMKLETISSNSTIISHVSLDHAGADFTGMQLRRICTLCHKGIFWRILSHFIMDRASRVSGIFYELEEAPAATVRVRTNWTR